MRYTGKFRGCERPLLVRPTKKKRKEGTKKEVLHVSNCIKLHLDPYKMLTIFWGAVKVSKSAYGREDEIYRAV